MFNSEFYPAPKSVIRKMLAPYESKYGYKLAGKTILEPSAGKGDILDFISDSGVRKNKLYACEINQDLQYILQEKGYKVINNDFLTYQGDYHFDLIIGNPPFSNGDEHLLKAWSILEEGEIIFLLNAETILNPYTEKRKLIIKLIEDFGSYEVLGDVFADAERKTGVNVALVRLQKVAVDKRFDFKFKNVTKEQHFNLNEETIKDQVATLDVVGNMVLQYSELKLAYTEYLKAADRLHFYAQGLFKIDDVLKTIEGQSNNEKYNSFCDASKMQVWRQVIKKVGIERYMTNAVQQNFNRFTQTQGALDFTIENIQSLVAMLISNSDNILENAVLDVFDLFTKYHKENRFHVEGWKTNDKWKVNQKVILPNFLSSDFGEYFSASHYRWNEYSDVDRVMCYLSGKRYEDFDKPVQDYPYNTKRREKAFEIISLQHAVSCTKVGDSSLQESEFFYFRCYKKGTLHITFKDKFLWQEFNMRACSGKNWLSEAEKKTWKAQKPFVSNQLSIAA